MSSFGTNAIVDRIAATIASTFLTLGLRVGWDALEALHRAGLPVWPIIGRALPISIVRGIALPIALSRAREYRLAQQRNAGSDS